MVDFSSPAPSAGSVQENIFPVKPAIAVVLAALADWLFYDQQIGISAVVFTLALICGSVLVNLATLEKTQALLAGLVVLLGLLPAVEEFNAASLIFMLLSLGVGLQLAANRKFEWIGQRVSALRDLYLFGPFRFFREPRHVQFAEHVGGLAVWFVPVVLGGVFVFLFASANPLIERWVSLISPGNAASYIGVGRTLFWIVALSVVWPFIHVLWRNRPKAANHLAEAAAREHELPRRGTDLFGVATILVR